MGLTSVIQYLTPFLTLIIAYIAIKEALGKLEIANMFLAFAAVLMIVYSSNDSRESNN